MDVVESGSGPTFTYETLFLLYRQGYFLFPEMHFPLSLLINKVNKLIVLENGIEVWSGLKIVYAEMPIWKKGFS